ncbi:IclR family transcriptional regulator [Pseudonocardia spinosispora]|uniref:IclR family transcriptional regulator n=1 Tax=Pseudonocardia spinosispora TaxID=103441 RepID=UPI00048B51F9|nr:IclR family transcriptional regulator C-terminal domain-containing protein [Pseudonocardia spinosispora]
MSASVGKAAVILRAFRPTLEVLSVRSLAEYTGLPRSTVHLLCRTLVAEGLLESVPGGGYRLGPLLLELGGLIIDRTGLVGAVEGSAAAVRRGPGQELHVGQLVDGWIVYVHRESGPTRVRMINWVGMRAPAFLSGCGKSALSALDPADAEHRVRRLCAQEDHPLPDMAALAEELAAARVRGHLVCRSFQRGRTSVAATVIGADGQPAGALSIAGPHSTFAPARIPEIGRAIAHAAAVTSHRLQHTMPRSRALDRTWPPSSNPARAFSSRAL